MKPVILQDEKPGIHVHAYVYVCVCVYTHTDARSPTLSNELSEELRLPLGDDPRHWGPKQAQN